MRTEDDERSTFWGLSCSICLDGADSKVDGFHLFSEDNFFGSNAAGHNFVIEITIIFLTKITV